MNRYEMFFIIKPEITEKQKNDVLSKIREHIINNGKIEMEEHLGIKKLAYEIHKHNTGDYYIVEFSIDETAISTLEQICIATAEIIKFIIVRKEAPFNE